MPSGDASGDVFDQLTRNQSIEQTHATPTSQKTGDVFDQLAKGDVFDQLIRGPQTPEDIRQRIDDRDTQYTVKYRPGYMWGHFDRDDQHTFGALAYRFLDDRQIHDFYAERKQLQQQVVAGDPAAQQQLDALERQYHDTVKAAVRKFDPTVFPEDEAKLRDNLRRVYQQKSVVGRAGTAVAQAIEGAGHNASQVLALDKLAHNMARFDETPEEWETAWNRKQILNNLHDEAQRETYPMTTGISHVAGNIVAPENILTGVGAAAAGGKVAAATGLPILGRLTGQVIHGAGMATSTAGTENRLPTLGEIATMTAANIVGGAAADKVSKALPFAQRASEASVAGRLAGNLGNKAADIGSKAVTNAAAFVGVNKTAATIEGKPYGWADASRDFVTGLALEPVGSIAGRITHGGTPRETPWTQFSTEQAAKDFVAKNPSTTYVPISDGQGNALHIVVPQGVVAVNQAQSHIRDRTGDQSVNLFPVDPRDVPNAQGPLGRQLARDAGVTLHWYVPEGKENEPIPEGWPLGISLGGGHIAIDARAANRMTIIPHEYLHELRREDTAGRQSYQQLLDLAKKVAPNRLAQDQAEYTELYQRTYGRELDPSIAQEEGLARFLQRMSSKEGGVDYLRRRDPTLMDRLSSFIRDTFGIPENPATMAQRRVNAAGRVGERIQTVQDLPGTAARETNQPISEMAAEISPPQKTAIQPVSEPAGQNAPDMAETSPPHEMGRGAASPPETKTSGQQMGLLGERYDGGIAGSKSDNMFGDTRPGPASELEAKGNDVGQAARDNETQEMFGNPSPPTVSPPAREFTIPAKAPSTPSPKQWTRDRIQNAILKAYEEQTGYGRDYHDTGDEGGIVLHPDQLDGLGKPEKRKVRRYVDEDKYSDRVASMDARQRDEFDRQMLHSALTDTNRAYVEQANEWAREHHDPALRFAEWMLSNRAGTQKQILDLTSHAKIEDLLGKTFTINKEPFHIEIDDAGMVHLVDTDVEFPGADRIGDGHVPIDKGSIRDQVAGKPLLNDEVPFSLHHGEERREGEKPGEKRFTISLPRDLTLEQQKVHEGLSRIVQDTSKADAAYDRLKDSLGGRVLNADTARELSPDYQTREDRLKNTPATYAAASVYVRDRFNRTIDKLAAEGKTPHVLFLAGGASSGKSSTVNDHYLRAFDVVFDSNLARLDTAKEMIEKVLKAGGDARVLYVHRPYEKAVENMLRRGNDGGRTVPLGGDNGKLAWLHKNAQDTFEKLVDHYADNESVSFRVFDNSGKIGESREISVKEFLRPVEKGGKYRYTSVHELTKADQPALDRFLRSGGDPAVATAATERKALAQSTGGLRHAGGDPNHEREVLQQETRQVTPPSSQLKDHPLFSLASDRAAEEYADSGESNKVRRSEPVQPSEPAKKPEEKKSEPVKGKLRSFYEQLKDEGKELIRDLRYVTNIDPVPNLTKAGAGDNAVSHASAMHSYKAITDRRILELLPNHSQDEAMLNKAGRLLNIDRIEGEYDKYMDRADKKTEQIEAKRKEPTTVPGANDVEIDNLVKSRDADRNHANALDHKHNMKAMALEKEELLKDPVIADFFKRWNESEYGAKFDNEHYNVIRGLDPDAPLAPRGRDGLGSTLVPNDKDLFDFGEGNFDPNDPKTIVGGDLSKAKVSQDRWDQAANGLGNYETNLDTILRTLQRSRWSKVTQREMEKDLVRRKLGYIQDHSPELVDENGKPVKFYPLTITTPKIMPTGYAKQVPAKMWIRSEVYREVRDVLNTDLALPQAKWAKWATNFQLMQIADAITHGKNMHTVLVHALGSESLARDLMRKVPGLGSADTLMEWGRTLKEAKNRDPQYIKDKAELAKQGLLRPEYPATGFQKITHAQEILHELDTTARVILYRRYKNLVARGMAVDTNAGLRQFVMQLGNYNRRLMHPIARAFRDLGLAPFIVAGRTFNRLGRRLLTGNPGFEATSYGKAAQARLISYGGLALSLGLLPALVNYATTGKAYGRSGVPFGAIDLGIDDKDGNPRTIDPLQLMGIRRGLRSIGANALIEGLRQGKDWNTIAGNAIDDIRNSALHPWMGPGVGFGVAAITGRRFDTRGKMEAQVIPEGGFKQNLENARAALESQNKLLYSTGRAVGSSASKLLGGEGTGQSVGKDWTDALDALVQSPTSAFGFKSVRPGTDAAQDMASRLAGSKMADSGPMSAAKREQISLIRNLVAGLRSGSPDAMERINQAVSDGKLSEKDIAGIIQRSSMSDLEWKVSHLSGSDAIKVYDAATEKEKTQLRDTVLNRVVKDNTLSSDERATILQHLEGSPDEARLSAELADLEASNRASNAAKRRIEALRSQIAAAEASGDDEESQRLRSQRQQLARAAAAMRVNPARLKRLRTIRTRMTKGRRLRIR